MYPHTNYVRKWNLRQLYSLKIQLENNWFTLENWSCVLLRKIWDFKIRPNNDTHILIDIQENDINKL